MKSRPAQEEPAVRLLHSGAGVLSDAELLTVLLRNGCLASAQRLSVALLSEGGGLAGLLAETPITIRRSGIGPAKTARLLAAIEVGRRLAREQMPKRHPLSRPAEVALYLLLRYRQRDQEVMGAIFLDVRHCLLGEREIFRGTLSRAAVEPREILKECLLRGAAAVVIFHTHPSGDPTPSGEDLMFTRRMAEAAAIVGVELVDHMILGAAGHWVSLREKAAW